MESISDGAGSCAGVMEMYMLGRGAAILQGDKRPVTAQRDQLAAELRPTHWHACLARCVQCPFLWGLVRGRLVPPHSTPRKGHWQYVASRLLWKDLRCKRAGVRSCEVSYSSTGLSHLVLCLFFKFTASSFPVL